MPLVAHSDLPTFERLKATGEEILALGQAQHQDIRELHIGFLNLMPDAAFEATERQFLRLVGSSNQIAQYYVHPFTLRDPQRSPRVADYISRYYQDPQSVMEAGLDALIITGTNPRNSRLEDEPFWEPLGKVVAWAQEQVTSLLCSCLAVHAIAQHLHDLHRQPLETKRWGVYSHRITDTIHPLLRNMNTRFDVPHSRTNDLSQDQLEAAGFKVLVKGETSGVHMAVSPDLFRVVFLQGHPEYDDNSLLKEFKREVTRHFKGEREAYPDYPEQYFNATSLGVLEHYKQTHLAALKAGHPQPDFPEKLLTPLLENTWRDTGKSVFNNWLGLVYQLTHVDRHQPFIHGVDPEDPLGIRHQYA